MKTFQNYIAESKVEGFGAVGKYYTLEIAKSVAMKQKHLVPVILGDDGKYWVPYSNKIASDLIKAGYQEAE
jgi:hypothetical protein